MTPVLLAGPTLEPLTLEETRAWLRLDTNDEDALVSSLIRAARVTVEQATRRAMMAQKWRLRMDRWPVDRIVQVPLSPILTLDAVRIFDAAGVARVLDLAGFFVDQSRAPQIVLDAAPAAPGRLRNGIEIDLTAGFGTVATSVPEPLRLAMRLLIAHWFERRGDALHEHSVPSLPAAVAAAIVPYRRARLV